MLTVICSTYDSGQKFTYCVMHFHKLLSDVDLLISPGLIGGTVLRVLYIQNLGFGICFVSNSHRMTVIPVPVLIKLCTYWSFCCWWFGSGRFGSLLVSGCSVFGESLSARKLLIASWFNRLS